MPFFFLQMASAMRRICTLVIEATQLCLFVSLQMASEMRRICTFVIEATQLCLFFFLHMASEMRRICTQWRQSGPKTPPKSVWDPFFVEFCGRLGVKLGSARRQCPGRYPSSLGSARILY